MENKRDEYPYCKCLLFSSGALSRVMNKLAEDSFKQTGLSASLAFVLMTVVKRPGISIGQLAKLMILAPSTLTRLVETLDNQGFLKKVPEGRTSIIFAKESGVDLDPVLRKCWTELYSKYNAILGVEFSKSLAETTFNASLMLNNP